MDVWKRQQPTRTTFAAAPQSVSPVVTDNSPVPLTGTRIRLTAPGVLADQLDATITRRTPDSLVVATQNGVEYAVAVSSVTSINRFDGRSAKQGAKKGFVIGSLIALPFALLLPVASDCSVACTVGFAAYIDAVYGGIGAAIGAGVGADKWTRIDLRPKVSALPNGRFGIGVNVR
jgi:hypothetical protein